MIYLDYASTTPMCKEALDAYIKTASSYYGNSNSLHDTGTTASHLLSACREKVGQFLNGEPHGIYFTSGGTESNNLAIRSLLKGNKNRGKHLITTALEHSSVLNTCRSLEKEGYSVTYLPVNQNGLISLQDLNDAIEQDTVLVAIQHVNHEIGTIQPIAQIGKLLREKHILFHCDCVQSFGKILIDVKSSCIDSLSVSSHKIHGPKGVGAVYINPLVQWLSVYEGSTHENGFRPGTVNVPGIVAFVTAAERAFLQLDSCYDTCSSLRAYLQNKLEPFGSFVDVEGDDDNCLPSIAGLTFTNVQGQYVMLQCNRYGIAVSTGSACQVGQQHPSETMLAIGKSDEKAKNFVRISFSSDTTFHDINKFVDVITILYKEFSYVK